MNKLIKAGGIGFLFIVITCIGAFIIEAQTKIFRRAYDNFILDVTAHPDGTACGARNAG